MSSNTPTLPCLVHSQGQVVPSSNTSPLPWIDVSKVPEVSDHQRMNERYALLASMTHFCLTSHAKEFMALYEMKNHCLHWSPKLWTHVEQMMLEEAFKKLMEQS